MAVDLRGWLISVGFLAAVTDDCALASKSALGVLLHVQANTKLSPGRASVSSLPIASICTLCSATTPRTAKRRTMFSLVGSICWPSSIRMSMSENPYFPADSQLPRRHYALQWRTNRAEGRTACTRRCARALGGRHPCLAGLAVREARGRRGRLAQWSL